MLKYFKFNHTLRWLSANTSMHMQTNNVKRRGACRGMGVCECEIPVPSVPVGNFMQHTRIAFRLQHTSHTRTLSHSSWHSRSLSLSFFAPRAAADRALTAIKAALFIAPVQHSKRPIYQNIASYVPGWKFSYPCLFFKLYLIYQTGNYL